MNKKQNKLQELNNMKKSKFVKSTLNLLEDMVIEHEQYLPNTLTMNLKDVNAVIGGKAIDEYLKEGLEAVGFKKVWFSYGDGHWMTIHNGSHRVSLGK